MPTAFTNPTTTHLAHHFRLTHPIPPTPTQGRIFVFDAEDEESKYAWMEAIGLARVEAVHKLNAYVS